jgi:hypothetical protein
VLQHQPLRGIAGASAFRLETAAAPAAFAVPGLVLLLCDREVKMVYLLRSFYSVVCIPSHALEEPRARTRRLLFSPSGAKFRTGLKTFLSPPVPLGLFPSAWKACVKLECVKDATEASSAPLGTRNVS